MEPEEMTVSERAAVITWHLWQGWTPTTAEVAARLRISRQGARSILRKCQNVVPIYQDEHRRWVFLR